MIPHHIADTSVMFIANGKSHSVQSDNPNFNQIIDGLVSSPQADPSELIELASPAETLTTNGKGVIEVRGNAVYAHGHYLDNVWVKKLLTMRRDGHDFDPMLKALDSLMRNPSETARERLPIFVEQSQLGVFPDGRIAALKVIRDDFTDCYTGTFDNSPGKVVKVDREEVDPNPNHECSSGLHLGAYAYLPSYGMHSENRRVVLCAFWPKDVVAVPRDYQGQKMRVCKYEVICEMDKDSLQDFIDKNQSVLRGYVAEPMEDDSYDDDDDYLYN